jgi:hypothetical protein
MAVRFQLVSARHLHYSATFEFYDHTAEQAVIPFPSDLRYVYHRVQLCDLLPHAKRPCAPGYIAVVGISSRGDHYIYVDSVFEGIRR